MQSLASKICSDMFKCIKSVDGFYIFLCIMCIWKGGTHIARAHNIEMQSTVWLSFFVFLVPKFVKHKLLFISVLLKAPSHLYSAVAIFGWKIKSVFIFQKIVSAFYYYCSFVNDGVQKIFFVKVVPLQDMHHSRIKCYNPYAASCFKLGASIRDKETEWPRVI